MMHPRLAEEITGPEHLRKATLLHQEDLARIEPDVSWSRWFEAAGLGTTPQGGPRFSQADHAIDAAVAGAGVVLGRISLAAKDLEDGRLVAPFELSMTMSSKTRFICAQGAKDRPAVRAFLDWITSEIRVDPAFAAGRQMVSASP
jgi:LysR family glycine cleavage system transcriptional activator